MTRPVAGVAAALVAGGALLAQQPPVPTFRVQVDAVETDAFVTDAQGNPVTGLTINDFQILEDGKPQVITSFAAVNIPFERQTQALADVSTSEPDVQANDRSDGRLYMFALDEVTADQALRTRAFLRRFLERNFAANDRAAVVFIGQQNGAVAQPFTNNRRLLLASIDRFTGGFSSEAAPGVAEGNAQEAGPANALIAGLAQAKRKEAELGDRRKMDSFRSITEMMASLHDRRKALLLLTPGLPGAIFRALAYHGGALTLVEESAHAAVVAATRGNVTIYPIDPSGLTLEGGLAEADAPSIRDTSNDDSAKNGTRQMDDRMSLSVLAQATGGFTLVNSNSFNATFDRIVRENSTYYLLGFTSSNDRRDGRHRDLQVRVNRPGLQVRSRDGYVAPMKNERGFVEARSIPSLSAPVSAAIASPLGGGDVPIRLFAAPYRNAESRDPVVAIVAEVDPAPLGLVQREGTDDSFRGQLEVGFLATDSRAKIYTGQHYSVNLALKPETYETAKRQGLRVLSEITLPPGRYQLRFAAGNPSGKAGNVVYDLMVPDFRKDPLMLSGLALTSASTSGAATVGTKDPLRDRLPRPPTAIREFDVGDSLMIFGEVYENGSNATAHSAGVSVELRSGDGRVVRSVQSQGPRFTAEMPLNGLAPGRYLVHVEARSTSGKNVTASREVPITVR
jgi:VWFA-related protein